MADFTVREYAFISAAYEGCPQSSIDHAYVPESAFNALCTLASTFSQQGARLFEIAGRRKLKLDQYVGIIDTPCGTRLEILPKHIDLSEVQDEEQLKEKERKLLRNMLEVALHLPSREVGAANLSRFKQPIHEWIIEQFLKEFQYLVQRGLRFDYQRVEEDQKFLRGQLKHAQYMRQPPSRKHIFPIEHDVYEVNRAENRLIKTALDVVCKKTKQASSWRLAQELRLMTNEIPKSQNIKHDFQQWQSGRLLALYEDIKPWCELILSEYMPVSTHGSWRGMSLLFPMEKLFEYYVAHHLKKALPDYQVKTQHASEHICTHKNRDIFKLKPDIYLKHKSTDQGIVMDTKWKLLNQQDYRYGLKDGDIQQMFAYSHFYLNHSSDVVLIYPKHKNFDKPLDLFEFRVETQARLWVIPFDLEQPNNTELKIDS